jgi:hypothetical protein
VTETFYEGEDRAVPGALPIGLDLRRHTGRPEIPQAPRHRFRIQRLTDLDGDPAQHLLGIRQLDVAAQLDRADHGLLGRRDRACEEREPERC